MKAHIKLIKIKRIRSFVIVQRLTNAKIRRQQTSNEDKKTELYVIKYYRIKYNKILKNKVKQDRTKHATMENSVPQDGPQLNQEV